jgi:hypothetical protein
MKKFDVRAILAPDYERYEGVRPIQICLMRLGYLLVFILVGNISWSAILTHEGTWDPLSAVALSMWAGSSVLSVLGLINPLRWIPLVLFEIAYKTIWLGVVAYPLWAKDQLVGSPAESMALSFVPVVFPILAMPWGYVWRTYVWPRHRSLKALASA